MNVTGGAVRQHWKKFVLILVIIVVGGGVYAFSGNGEDDGSDNTYTVSRQDVRDSVLLSGSVNAAQRVDLSFNASGKVAYLFAELGDSVVAGDVLAELRLDVLDAELARALSNIQAADADIRLAQAQVAKAQAQLEVVRAGNQGTTESILSAEENLERVREEQTQLVDNALRALLNNDLTVYPDVVVRQLPSFVLTGSYQGEEVGAYSFRAYSSSLSNIGISLDVSGIETDTVHFTDYNIPEPIGTKGLYISFPESGAGLNYNDSRWIIPIPNDRSATYQSTLNAYTQAQRAANKAITASENTLQQLLAQESGVSQTSAQENQALAALAEAEAALEKARTTRLQATANAESVRAQMRDRVILAPFDGVIARNAFRVGEIVSPSTLGMTLISEGAYELTMSVPEIDIAKIKEGEDASITLDVYDDVEWDGEVSDIQLIETEVDGVPVYETTIAIREPDERVRVGMNARAEIVIEEVTDVLAVPRSYIAYADDQPYVLIHKDEVHEKRDIAVGLVGSNNMVEVTSGVSEGEVLVRP